MSLTNRLARVVFKERKYLFNPTNELLSPGDVVSVTDGELLSYRITDRLSGEDKARAEALLSRPPVKKPMSEVVQRGFNLEVGLVAGVDGALPTATGSVAAEVNFGLGGGCFLDVTQEVDVLLLAEEDRYWLFKKAFEILQPEQMLVVEVVRSGYVAASTRQASAKLGLTLDATVDPNAVGLGNLGDFMADGKLNVSVKKGRVWRAASAMGAPMFRGYKVKNLPDLFGADVDSGPDLRLYGVDGQGGALPTRPMVIPATPDDLRGLYGDDED